MGSGPSGTSCLKQQKAAAPVTHREGPGHGRWAGLSDARGGTQGQLWWTGCPGREGHNHGQPKRGGHRPSWILKAFRGCWRYLSRCRKETTFCYLSTRTPPGEGGFFCAISTWTQCRQGGGSTPSPTRPSVDTGGPLFHVPLDPVHTRGSLCSIHIHLDPV